MVVLVDGYPQWKPHVGVIKRRLEEELKNSRRRDFVSSDKI